MEKKDFQDKVECAIQLWNNTFPKVDVTAKQIVGRIILANSLILEKMRQAFDAFDLSPTEYAILCTLRLHGPPFQLPPKVIMQKVLLSSGGMSNLFIKMEKKGFIARLPDPSDRRGVIVKLLPQGKTTINKAMVLHAKIEKQFVASLNPEEFNKLAQLLNKFINHLD